MHVVYLSSKVVTYSEGGDLTPILDEAVQVLERGGLVVYPTDTSYGIGCDPGIDAAVDRLIQVKHRDPLMGLPLLFHDLEQCKEYHDFYGLELALARLFWPGALTMIVCPSREVSPRIRGRHESIAIRVPDHVIPRGMARRIGAPIVGTSANISGGPTPFDVDSARLQLGDEVDLYIDGGRSSATANSTIVRVDGNTPASIRVYREGAISIENLTRVLRSDAAAMELWTARIIHHES